MERVNYCLVCGTSETRKPRERCPSGVNYYLDYRTSETNGEVRTILQVVNYCLVYGTFETRYTFDGRGKWVNCCLDYGTSETPICCSCAAT